MSNAARAEIKTVGVNVFNGGQPREKRIRVVDKSKAASVEEIGKQRKLAFEDAKKEIARCSHNIGASFYALGLALKEVKERELWKEGNAKSWPKFAASISGVTYATVCNLIAVVENLTVDVACKFGPTISYAIARAPGKDCQDELIKLASKGATVREINKAAHKQRVKAGTTRPRKSKAETKSKAKKGQPRDIRADLESKADQTTHDAKVSTVGKGVCKLKKGKGTFVVDGITVEVKLVGKSKLEYVARLG